MSTKKRLTRGKDWLFNSDPLVQAAESTVLGLQRGLEGVVTSEILGIVGMGETVVLEDKADDLSEDLLSSLLLVVIVIVIAEGVERRGLDDGWDSGQGRGLHDLTCQKGRHTGNGQTYGGEEFVLVIVTVMTVMVVVVVAMMIVVMVVVVVRRSQGVVVGSLVIISHVPNPIPIRDMNVLTKKVICMFLLSRTSWACPSNYHCQPRLSQGH
jgi:hypothetical protein